MNSVWLEMRIVRDADDIDSAIWIYCILIRTHLIMTSIDKMARAIRVNVRLLVLIQLSAFNISKYEI